MSILTLLLLFVKNGGEPGKGGTGQLGSRGQKGANTGPFSAIKCYGAEYGDDSNGEQDDGTQGGAGGNGGDGGQGGSGGDGAGGSSIAIAVAGTSSPLLVDVTTEFGSAGGPGGAEAAFHDGSKVIVAFLPFFLSIC